MCTACFLDRCKLSTKKFPHDYANNCEKKKELNKRINIKKGKRKFYIQKPL